VVGEERNREIVEAVDRLGHRIREIVALKPIEPRKRGRSAHRVELEGGGRIKARVLESDAAVQELLRMREGLEPAFVPALAGHGRVLLEAWVEGELLSEHEARSRIGDAGALLGRLHAATPPSAAPSMSTAPRRRQAELGLQSLEEAEKLASREVAALRLSLERLDPGSSPVALVHRDFCAENMLIDDSGRLRVFDNELIELGPAGLDLGRSLHRWPMSVAEQRQFLAAYRSSAPRDPGPIAFWILVAVVWSARVRLDQPPERQAIPLEAARRYARDPHAILEAL
jgi:Ser/Thr protein kinase RdoA (MazF antagonist)